MSQTPVALATKTAKMARSAKTKSASLTQVVKMTLPAPTARSVKIRNARSRSAMTRLPARQVKSVRADAAGVAKAMDLVEPAKFARMAFAKAAVVTTRDAKAAKSAMLSTIFVWSVLTTPTAKTGRFVQSLPANLAPRMRTAERVSFAKPDSALREIAVLQQTAATIRSVLKISAPHVLPMRTVGKAAFATVESAWWAVARTPTVRKAFAQTVSAWAVSPTVIAPKDKSAKTASVLNALKMSIVDRVSCA